MKKISSDSTMFYKRVLPLLWYGLLLFFVATAALRRDVPSDRWVVFLAVPCLMAVFGFFLLKRLVWDLMDEVHDCGDSLLVRKSGEEERIPLSNIMSVRASRKGNPARITLRLGRPGRFGFRVSFSPLARLSFNPFAKNPVAEDLILRVDRARLRRDEPR